MSETFAAKERNGAGNWFYFFKKKKMCRIQKTKEFIGERNIGRDNLLKPGNGGLLLTDLGQKSKEIDLDWGEFFDAYLFWVAEKIALEIAKSQL